MEEKKDICKLLGHRVNLAQYNSSLNDFKEFDKAIQGIGEESERCKINILRRRKNDTDLQSPRMTSIDFLRSIKSTLMVILECEKKSYDLHIERYGEFDKEMLLGYIYKHIKESNRIIKDANTFLVEQGISAGRVK